MSQLPDPGNPAEAARAALGGIKEAIKVGREIKEVGKEMNSFLDEEAKAPGKLGQRARLAQTLKGLKKK